MVSAQEIQAQLNYEMAVYREQINMIKREIERVSLTTIDLSNALKTVERLNQEEALVPIGGGALMRTKVSNTKILVPVGGEYIVEMEKESAAEELKKRVEATKKAVEKLNEEFAKIANKLKDTTGQLQDIQVQNQINKRVDSNIRDDYI